MEIRPMSEKDLDQVCDIENDIFSTPWSKKSFLSSINSKDNIYLVAKEEGIIVGYCGLWGTVDEGQITNVAVKKEFRMKHIGSRLVKTLMEYGKEAGLITFSLEVRTSNHAAKKMYEKLGFKSCGVRKNYYTLPTEDAVIMIAD